MKRVGTPKEGQAKEGSGSGPRPSEKAAHSMPSTSRFGKKLTTEAAEQPRTTAVEQSFGGINALSAEELEQILSEQEETKPIEVVELSGERLRERFLEFVSRSLVVRSYEGAQKPGPVVHAVTPSAKLAVTRFMDSDFFYITEEAKVHLLCSPTTTDADQLQNIFEATFQIQCIESAQMMANVRLGLDAMSRVWQFVAKRKEQQKEIYDAAAEAEQGRAGVVIDVSQNSGGLGPSSQQSSLTFFVNEFVLLYSQHQPLVVLHAALDRLYSQIDKYDIGHRFALALPVGDCLVSLTDTLAGCSQPTLVESICQCGFALVTHLRVEDLHSVCHRHADALLAHLFLVLGRQTMCYSKGLDRFISALAGVILSGRIAKRMSSVGEGSSLSENAEAVQKLAACCSRCLEAMIPSQTDVGITLDEIKEVVAPALVDPELAGWSSGRVGHGPQGAPKGPKQHSSRAAKKLLSHHGSSAQKNRTLTSLYLGGKEEGSYIQRSNPYVDSVEELVVLWCGGSNILEATIPALDNIVQCIDAEDTIVKKNGRRLLQTTVGLAKVAVRTLWFAPPSVVIRLLGSGSAALCSFFRRVAQWCVMFDEDTLWVDVLQAATALILTKAMITGQEKAPQLDFIQHQWIVKITVGCGPAAERSILSEINLFYCVMTRLRQTEGHTLAAVWKEVHLVVAAICAAAPSPSRVETVFTAVLEAVDAFQQLARRSTAIPARKFLMALMFTSIVDLTTAEFVRQYHIPEAVAYLRTAHWDTYDEFGDAERMNQMALNYRTIFQGVSALDLVLVAAPLVYVVDALRQDIQTGRELSYGKDCVAFADELIKCGAPQSIANLLVMSGIMALRSTSAYHAEVEAILSSRYASTLWSSADLPRAFALARIVAGHSMEQDPSKSAKVASAVDPFRAQPHHQTPGPTSSPPSSRTLREHRDPNRSVSPPAANRNLLHSFAHAEDERDAGSLMLTPPPATTGNVAKKRGTPKRSAALDMIARTYARR